MEPARSLQHRKSGLDFAAESGEKLAQPLAFGMMLKIGENFDARGFISQIGQPDRAQIRVLQSPTLTLRGSDGHAQCAAIALPGDDDRGETALPNR